VKKNQIIKELELRIKNPTMKAYLTKENPFLLHSLKAKKSEAQAENLKLRKELKRLQRNKRFTQVNELEGEQSAFSREMERLQEMVEKAKNATELIPIEDVEVNKARIKEQDEVLAALKDEQKRLLEELKQKEIKIKRYKKMAEKQKKGAKGNMNTEIKQLKEKIISIKKESVSEEELEKLRIDRNKAKEKVEEQKKRIAELEKAIKDTEASKASYKELGDIKEKVLEIVEKLKENLRKHNVDIKGIKEVLFEHFGIAEKVSLHELFKIFTRQPCELSPKDSLLLAEYLIGKLNTTGHTKFIAEKVLSEVLEKLNSLMKGKFAEPEGKKSTELEENGLSQLEKMSEDELRLVFQRAYAKISSKINGSKKSVEEIFSEATYPKKIEGEEVIVIKSKDLIKICKEQLNVILDPIERTCFVKMLSIDDDELIKIQDLAQLIKGFSEGEDFEGEEEEMNYKELDKISMVLMFALTEYMNNSKITFHDLFADHIYKQEVQIDSGQLEIDIINSEDFFEVLNKIGISMENKEHDNLKAFLYIDPEYPNKLVVKKLKKTIEEFGSSDELRNYAYTCYKEFADDKDEGKE